MFATSVGIERLQAQHGLNLGAWSSRVDADDAVITRSAQRLALDLHTTAALAKPKTPAVDVKSLISDLFARVTEKPSPKAKDYTGRAILVASSHRRAPVRKSDNISAGGKSGQGQARPSSRAAEGRAQGIGILKARTTRRANRPLSLAAAKPTKCACGRRR